MILKTGGPATEAPAKKIVVKLQKQSALSAAAQQFEETNAIERLRQVHMIPPALVVTPPPDVPISQLLLGKAGKQPKP